MPLPAPVTSARAKRARKTKNIRRAVEDFSLDGIVDEIVTLADIRPAEGAPYLLLNGSSAYISTPDSVPLSITGDLEIQVDIWLPDNRYLWDLCNKYGGAGARSWALQINAGGTVSLYWSADGTSLLGSTSTMPIWPCSVETVPSAAITILSGARSVGFPPARAV